MATLKVDYSDGDILYAGSNLAANSGVNAISTQINTNTAKIWTGLEHRAQGAPSAGSKRGMVSCSSTTFIATDGTNTQQGVLSSGILTWTAKDDKIASPLALVTCDADPTKVLIFNTTNDISWSDDSGATWTIAGTPPPNCTTIKDVHFFSATLAVMVGNAASGQEVWKSTDGGDVWVQLTGSGLAGSTGLVSMFDATNGFIIKDDNAIFTYNGDNTYTDTGHTTNLATGAIYALSASTFLHVISARQAAQKSVQMEYYDGTQNCYAICNPAQIDEQIATNIIQATNGYYYFIAIDSATSADIKIVPILLFRSIDALAWEYRVVGATNTANGKIGGYGMQLSEYDTNKLVYGSFNGGHLFIDES